MSNLLNAADDPDTMTSLLEAARDWLLEPLEDVDGAVLETDSIYTPQMTRAQRYQTYRQTMQERIQGARNGSVRTVLQTMSDFVLSHE